MRRWRAGIEGGIIGTCETDAEATVETMKWSQSEKRIARSVFQRAVDIELDELMAEFKRRAADVRTPEQMWALRNHLERTERDFQAKYDFRYSRLLFVFARLVREGRVGEQDLHGLSEDKLRGIRDIMSL